jgi:hypothetical protein
MNIKELKLPKLDPSRIYRLRDSSFANDLFIMAVGHLAFFTRLSKHPLDFTGICEQFKIQPRPADVMLTLFKSYGFIREDNGIFSLTGLSKEYLNNGSFWDLSQYVGSLKDRPICLSMLDVFKFGRPANWAGNKDGNEWKLSMENPQFAESFIDGMNSRGTYLAKGIAKKINMSKYKRLLDIGGGSGIYSVVFLSEFNRLSATVYDKPPVEQIAQYCIKKHGLESRMNTIGGNFFTDGIPTGYDVHFLSHTLHDWNEGQVEETLKKSYLSLNEGGVLIVHDAHVNRDKSGPVSIAEYSVLLMYSTEGKCYSTGEMENILQRVGFRKFQHIPTILNRSIIIGRK